jgi:Mrp family chromosome partitioning ATPase
MPVFFTPALRIAGETVRKVLAESLTDVRLIREDDGRISFAVDCARADMPASASDALTECRRELGFYHSGKEVLFRDDLVEADTFFNEGWCQTNLPQSNDGVAFLVRDLPTWGRDWLHIERGDATRTSKRVVFHGLKGGVGRSTAMTVLARALAGRGKKVLVVDLDLESPGVSGLMLDPADAPAFGVMDWLVEDGLHQGSLVLRDMLAESRLSRDLSGSILVAPACGKDESEYVAKLGRAYRDVKGVDKEERFADRLSRLIADLEAAESPDFVLIDSRAGLHEVAAVAISRLSDVSLLFAIDSPQNWDGYGQLFAHWQSRPEVLKQVREKLMIVRALAGDSARGEGFSRFLEKSFDLFSSHLYDVVDGSIPEVGLFSFDLNDVGAPHYPPLIVWDPRFQEYDPLLRDDRGGLSDQQVQLAFGGFIDRVLDFVIEDQP